MKANYIVTVYNRDTNAFVCCQSAETRREAELMKADHLARFPNDRVEIALGKISS